MVVSAGIIPYRIGKIKEPEFLVGHPGGNKRDVWYYLKGQLEPGENIRTAAIREFKEESGLDFDDSIFDNMIDLGSVLQNPNKTVYAFGLNYPDINPNDCHSNICPDGVTPEMDKFAWMPYSILMKKTHPQHKAFYDKLI